MKLSPGSILTGALLGGLCIGIWSAGRDSERAKAWHAERARMDSVVVALAQVYRVDTVRVTRTRVITDSVIASSGDSLARGTVIELVRVERAACNAALQTCEQRIVAATNRLKLEQRKPGPRLMGTAIEAGWSWPANAPMAALEGRLGTRLSLRVRAGATFGDTARGRIDALVRFEP